MKVTGNDDPTVRLLEVTVEYGEFWYTVLSFDITEEASDGASVDP